MSRAVGRSGGAPEELQVITLKVGVQLQALLPASAAEGRREPLPLLLCRLLSPFAPLAENKNVRARKGLVSYRDVHRPNICYVFYTEVGWKSCSRRD